MFEKQCFAVWPGPESQSIKGNVFEKDILGLMQAKLFDKKCFSTWPNCKTYCLTIKFQMFEKQCFAVRVGPESQSRKGNILKKFKDICSLMQAKLFDELFFRHGQTIKHIVWRENFKCLTNKVF